MTTGWMMHGPMSASDAYLGLKLGQQKGGSCKRFCILLGACQDWIDLASG